MKDEMKGAAMKGGTARSSKKRVPSSEFQVRSYDSAGRHLTDLGTRNSELETWNLEL